MVAPLDIADFCATLDEAREVIRRMERQAMETATALSFALDHCECEDGTRGEAAGSAIRVNAWERMHALAAKGSTS